MRRTHSGDVDVEGAVADEDANGDGEADAGGRVVRHTLAERVEHVAQHIRDCVWKMVLGVRQGGHDGNPESEEGGGEDCAVTWGDGAAG